MAYVMQHGNLYDEHGERIGQVDTGGSPSSLGRSVCRNISPIPRPRRNAGEKCSRSRLCKAEVTWPKPYWRKRK
jgi:hypothetical protein